MPPATRKSDVCTGHPCFPPRPSSSGSGDTFTNNLAQMRLTDSYVPHGCCCCPAHGGMLACGSGTVNVNNLPAGRQGDCVDCGSFADQHSGDVNIGG